MKVCLVLVFFDVGVGNNKLPQNLVIGTINIYYPTVSKG